MTSRQYGQSCSLACALDRIGERWTLLIVRELSLGPLRFSALARSVGGAPTDILTKRLRDLEQHGIVARRELEPPGLGDRLRADRAGPRAGASDDRAEPLGDGPAEARGRGRPGAFLAAQRDPGDPAAARRTCGWSSACAATASPTSCASPDGWIDAARDDANCDLSLAGTPIEVIAALVAGEADEEGVEIEGDRELLKQLRSMVVIPEHLREEALAAVTPRAAGRSQPW